MSFDVYLQRFVDGQPADGDGDALLAVLTPLIVERAGSWARIVTADGEADVYGIGTLQAGLMVNHASGVAVWDVVYELARAGRMAVMPVGCPTAVVDQNLLDALPEGAPPAVVVTSGADILDLVQKT